jgi:ribosomal subunit interface protein
MQTKFVAKDTEITEDDRRYVLKRLGEIEEVFDSDSLFEVEIGKDKRNFFRVEVNVSAPGNELHRGEEISESVEGSIDIVIDKLRIQAVRGKDKARDLRDRGARSIKKKIALDESARF